MNRKSVRAVLAIFLGALFLFSKNSYAVLPPITEGIVATVSGEIIFKSDLAEYAGTEYEDTALNNLIEMKILYLLGKESGIQVDQNEVQQYVSQKIEQLKQYYGGETGFKAAVKANGYTLENFLKEQEQEIEQQLIALRMQQAKLAELRSGILVSRNQVIDYYNKHKDMFMRPEQRRISYILIKFGDNEDKAFALAKQVYNVVAEGASFDSVAKQYNNVIGGDFGYISKGTIMPEVEKVAFSLSVGDISEPIKTKIGYIIVKVTDIKPGELADIKDPAVFKQVRNVYINSLIQKEYYNWLDEEKKKFDIEFLEK